MKKKSNEAKQIGKVLLHFVKLPYYFGKGIYSLGKFANKKLKKKILKKSEEQ